MGLKVRWVEWIKENFGVWVMVQWENESFWHYSWTMKGAIEWMACYPIEADVQCVSMHPFSSAYQARY